VREAGGQKGDCWAIVGSTVLKSCKAPLWDLEVRCPVRYRKGRARGTWRRARAGGHWGPLGPGISSAQWPVGPSTKLTPREVQLLLW
jgi:hypothetical protein